jgi:murein hydrolase activator
VLFLLSLLAMDSAAAQSERERINQQLVDTAQLVQRGEAALSAVESRLGELDAQEKLVRGSLAQRHESISQLLAAMQRMGRNPPPVMITRREDALSMVRSAMLLASAFPELRTQALALAERLDELARVMGEAKKETDKLKAETTRLAETRKRLAELMDSRRQNQAERQAELDRLRRETTEIVQNASDLNELIARLDRTVGVRPTREAAVTPPRAAPRPSAPDPKPDALASAERTPPVPSTPAAPPSRPPQSVSPPAAPPEATDTSKSEPPAKPVIAAIEIAPKGSQLPKRDFGRIEPAMPFIQAKGRLSLPARGNKVLAFGEKTQYGSQSKGIVLETRHGAQVTSPSDGWVIFAGEFRTFGQLLIIDGGGGYHILLAGLSQIDAQPRQFVLAGEPVGMMTSAPKAAASKSGDGAPVLYIEFRKDNKPIDPDPWWVAEAQKVQG